VVWWVLVAVVLNSSGLRLWGHYCPKREIRWFSLSQTDPIPATTGCPLANNAVAKPSPKKCCKAPVEQPHSVLSNENTLAEKGTDCCCEHRLIALDGLPDSVAPQVFGFQPVVYWQVPTLFPFACFFSPATRPTDIRIPRAPPEPIFANHRAQQLFSVWRI
jgi:hypothetical protein